MYIKIPPIIIDNIDNFAELVMVDFFNVNSMIDNGLSTLNKVSVLGNNVYTIEYIKDHTELGKTNLHSFIYVDQLIMNVIEFTERTQHVNNIKIIIDSYERELLIDQILQ